MRQTLLFLCLGFQALCLAGCTGLPTGQPRADNHIDAITIRNVPLTINGESAYKVYVYVTDSMSQRDPPKAMGTALLNGAATITVSMYNPPQEYRGKDPDEHGGQWSGVGNYFSVVISPRNAPNKDAILVRAGQSFNKSNRDCDFNRLIRVSESSFFVSKTTAVYDEIIRNDNKGIGTDISTP